MKLRQLEMLLKGHSLGTPNVSPVLVTRQKSVYRYGKGVVEM
jgi:hypothetical protein